MSHNFPGTPPKPSEFKKVFGPQPPIIYASKLSEAYKADEEKIRYDLIPPEAMDAMAEVLTFGAKKYTDRNWEKGMAWGRAFRALISHAYKWWRGIPSDEESGMSHMAHCLCCAIFLVTYERRGIGDDNRPKF